MADENDAGDAQQGTEEAKAPEQKPTEAAATPAELETLRAENTRLLAEHAAARKEAEGAQAYVQQMMGTLREAAANASRANADGEQPTLKDKLDADPEGVLDEHFRTRMGPLYAGYMENQSNMNRQLFADRIARDPEWKEDWTKYEKEVDEFMKTVPPDVRAQPGAYERAFKFVLAEHLDDVVKARKTRSISPQEKAAFVEGPSGAAPRERKVETLTDVEKQVAKGLGISETEYVEWSKKDQYGA